MKYCYYNHDYNQWHYDCLQKNLTICNEKELARRRMNPDAFHCNHGFD